MSLTVLQYVEPFIWGSTAPFAQLIYLPYLIHPVHLTKDTLPHCTISTHSTQVLENKRLTFIHH